MRRNEKKSSWCLRGWAFWGDLLALPGTGSQICSIPLSSRVPCKRLLTFIYLWIDIANLQSLLRKSENNYLRKLVLLYTPLPEGSWALIHEWLMSTRVDSYASLASVCCAPLLFLERFLTYSMHSHHIEARTTRHGKSAADSFFSLARQQLLWYSLFFFWNWIIHSIVVSSWWHEIHKSPPRQF